LNDDPLRGGDHQNSTDDTDSKKPPTRVLRIAATLEQPCLDGVQNGIGQLADRLARAAEGADALRAHRPGAQGNCPAQHEDSEDRYPNDVVSEH
jgi:hypothetical protein